MADVERVLKQLEGYEGEALLMEPRELYDPCLVGVVERFHDTFALYSRKAVLAAIERDLQSGVLPEPDATDIAREHYEFNVVGGWLGSGTPAFLIDDEGDPE